MKTVTELLAALPDRVNTFAGSEYSLPLCQGVLGEVPTIDAVRKLVTEADPEDAGHFALHVAMAAECCEAGGPDAEELFVSDGELRGKVFRGAKWLAGWAFLLGSEAAALKPELEEREFMVLESAGRPTHAVYWLQMMVRYAMTWGRIPPGEDHEMGHFLEDDLPGVLIVRGETCELESLLALAMMKLGCPAVVPEDFPFEEGRQARVRDNAEALDAIATLPNLRVKEAEGRRVALPAYCNPAHAKEPFEAVRAIGGDELSFFLLRPAKAGKGADVAGTPDGSLGVLIEVGDERLDLPTSEFVERTALQLIDYLPGVRVQSAEPFAVGLSAGVELDAERLAGVLSEGLKWHFSRLHDIRVRLIFDPTELRLRRDEVRTFKRERERVIAGLHEENVDDFLACIECQPFAQGHVCVITPDRPPMCGRDPGQVRAGALFGATWHPYRRQTQKAEQLREVIPKGGCLDPVRGEYSGVNEAVRRLSGGKVQRMFLHSLNDYPGTSCGCFGCVGFRIDGYGVGVMSRSFKGRAPNGETWDTLANRAGGKQADGVAGFRPPYLRSPKFLQADGGLDAVVWLNQDLLDKVADLFPADRRPATENDVATLEDLDEFLKAR